MVDISSLTTLRVPAKAKKIIEINTLADIQKLPSENVFFLGEGANVLFTRDYPGTIAKINLPGMTIIKETSDAVIVEAGAGENWHKFVTWAVSQNLSGVENLVLVPGTIGAAVVGNIACYGGNQEDVFIKLQATNLKSQKIEEFSKKDCQFSYRESWFKIHPEYLITSITYRLSKTAHLETSYRAARHASLLPTLEKLASPPYTVKNVYDAIIKIRTEKLPDWTKIRTAGSFFKNPVILKSQIPSLKSQIPDLQTYPAEKLSYINPSESDNYIKIPAGMLLEKLGWRGRRIGNVGTWDKHALIIVAYPGATGGEIYEFAEAMRADVKKHFTIDLEYEVVIM